MKTFKSTLKEVNALYQVNKIIHNVKITNSQSANDFIRQVYPVDISYREVMIALYLNNANRTLSFSLMSVGGLTSTMMDVRLVLRDALLSKATAMILIHNHPSQTLTASNADVTITKKVKEAGLLMDIKLLDHLILTQDNYYSFADDGVL